VVGEEAHGRGDGLRLHRVERRPAAVQQRTGDQNERPHGGHATMLAVDERLEDFAGLLRQNGLRISPAEVADAAQAALLVGMEDRAAFRGALRATLVKRGQDAPVFDRLFELYFTGAKDLVEGLQESLLDALESEKLDELQLEEIARMLARMSPL